MRWLVALAVALLASSGCAERRPDAAREGAGFRYLARGVYEALLMESCPPVTRLPRATVLARERAAVRAFEQRAGAGAHSHLEIARNDIAYRRASDTLGCWSDSDEGFAASHVEMARERVRSGLRDMAPLAPGLAALPDSIGVLPPARSAAFRARVGALVEQLQPLCPIDATADDDRILAPARAELRRFRQRLQDTPYASHFDLAEADGLHERSLTVAECVEPGRGPAAEASRRALAETRRQIARIAAFAGL